MCRSWNLIECRPSCPTGFVSRFWTSRDPFMQAQEDLRYFPGARPVALEGGRRAVLRRRGHVVVTYVLLEDKEGRRAPEEGET